MDSMSKEKYDLKPALEKIEAVIAKGPFTDTWESLAGYIVPKWYGKAKFGIFVHWGIYSVPAYGSEWYSRNMYVKGSREYLHHIATYGKHKDFGYKDFIPLFKAESFDANEWVRLFKDAGAKYTVFVAEHHDGFQMYDSSISDWNIAKMGPKKDTLRQLDTACAENDIVFGASSHRAEHWFFMGYGKEFESDIKEPMERGDFYWPAQKSPNHQDLFGKPAPTAEYLEDWLVRTCELIDEYQPKVLYFDWWIQHSAFKPYLKKLAAFYYNRGEEWGSGAVICYKHDAYLFGTALPDVERGQFSKTQPFLWQTDTSVALNSWGYTKNNNYRLAKDIVCDLVDIVSKNGNLLLNVGPKSDGTIPDEDASILKDIGKWLAVNGEAIYNSTPYRTFGEGPTKITEGQFSDGKKKRFTHKDVRFTVANGYLYTTVMKCNPKGKYCITTLAERDASRVANFHGIIKDITLLGCDKKPTWKRNSKGLFIDSDFYCEYPIVFRIQLQ